MTGSTPAENIRGDTQFRAFINDTLEKIEQDGRWLAARDATAGRVATDKPTPPAIDRYSTKPAQRSVR